MAATTLDKYCGSVFWNSSLSWNTDDPDLTRCFENTVLVWTPCVFLWVFSSVLVYNIINSKNRDIPWNPLNISKLTITVILFIITASDFVILLKYGSPLRYERIYNVDIYTPVVKLASFALSAILLIYSRKYAIRTSGVQFLFYLLLSICGFFQFRTELRRTGKELESTYYFYISYLIYYPLVLVMLLLNCFADQEAKRSRYPKQRKPCPEQSSSFLSQMLFTWFDPFAWRGFRKPLVEDDLWEMKPEDAAEEIGRKFERNWEKTQKKLRKRHHSRASYNLESARVDIVDDSSNERTILPALIQTFGLEFFFGVFLQIIQVVFLFVNPMILNILIDYIQTSEPLWKGYFYAFLLFTMASLQTIILSQYNNKMHVLGMRMRSAVITAIYKKLLKVTNKVRKEKSAGELVNLMAVDAQNFVDLVPLINIVWSAPLQILLALYFLWNILGPSVLAGVGVMLLLIPVNGYITKKTQVFQLTQMKNKDERVKMMNEILGGVKMLKLYAWEKSFEKKVLEIRKKEVKVLKKSAYLYSSMYFIWNCAPFLVCLTTFVVFVYSDSSNILTPQIAIVSLALFNIMRIPMSALPMLMIFCVETWVSIKRISAFMTSEELNPDNVTHDSYEISPVIIENGTFSWDTDPILKNINIRFDNHTITAVVGSVGSGKTSLLTAILGEMSKISGRVNTLGSIAYVPQQAWIQNATLRDNILFGKPFDRNSYEEVLECCALKSDLAMLSGGDQTEIGEKGINVSGGQKQRISLARAVYANADVYLLDDPLSAVDSHVGKHIFDKVIGPNGLLKGKTRIFVTHGVGFLTQTDKVVVMKDGEISEVGSYDELLNGKGAFSEFLLQYINEKESEESEEKQESNRANGIKSSKTELNSKSDSIDNIKEDEQPDKLIEAEKIETGGVKWSVYKYYFKAIGVFIAVLAILFNILFQVFSIGSNMWLTVWSTDPTVIDANGTVNASKRDFYLGVYSALGIAQALAILFSAMALQIGTINGAWILHKKLLLKILRAPCTTFFDVTPIGRILNVFSVDLDTLDSVLSFVFIGFFTATFTVIGTIFVISYTTPIFLSLTLPIAVLYYFVQRVYVTISRQLKRLESVSRSPIYSHFGETISGVQAIRAFQAQRRFIRQSENKVDDNQICHFPSIISNQWLSVRLEMIGNFIILFAAIFAVTQRDQNPGLVALSVFYALNFSQNLNYLVQSSSEVETNVVAVERIKENSKPPQEAPWEIPKKEPSSSWPEFGTIQFKNYSVKYRPALDLVLKNINLEIRGGEKIGIVGRTGAGKSSLTMALFRIIEATEGEILIDGVNISTIGLHTLRSRLTIIPQDSVLFSGSIRMNLDPSEEYSDEEIWKALEHSNLKAYVQGLTAGLHHEVTEGGENFSVGQRQLFCLSRALLRKTKILIFDEATAAIDLESDDLVQKTIKNEFGDCTILTIAHRLNTILDSDKVVVLEHGKIAEFDSPVNLLKRSNSIFYSMCKDAGLA